MFEEFGKFVTENLEKYLQRVRSVQLLGDLLCLELLEFMVVTIGC